jgi:toxin ParE1/3/4
MSVHKRRLHPRARADLRSILLYTRAQWGPEQRRHYRARLDQGIGSLTRYPEIEEVRDDLFPGCRAFRIEQHIIYYHVTDAEIVIGRVLHVRQDPTGKVMP